MTRFLIAGHLNGELEVLTKLHTLVREHRPAAVLFVGSLLASNPASHIDPSFDKTDAFNLPDGFDSLQSTMLASVSVSTVLRG
jgi:hypothetical protein